MASVVTCAQCRMPFTGPDLPDSDKLRCPACCANLVQGKSLNAAIAAKRLAKIQAMPAGSPPAEFAPRGRRKGYLDELDGLLASKRTDGNADQNRAHSSSPQDERIADLNVCWKRVHDGLRLMYLSLVTAVLGGVAVAGLLVLMLLASSRLNAMGLDSSNCAIGAARMYGLVGLGCYCWYFGGAWMCVCIPAPRPKAWMMGHIGFLFFGLALCFSAVYLNPRRSQLALPPLDILYIASFLSFLMGQACVGNVMRQIAERFSKTKLAFDCRQFYLLHLLVGPLLGLVAATFVGHIIWPIVSAIFVIIYGLIAFLWYLELLRLTRKAIGQVG